jgi:hypothetical protein
LTWKFVYADKIKITRAESLGDQLFVPRVN